MKGWLYDMQYVALPDCTAHDLSSNLSCTVVRTAILTRLCKVSGRGKREVWLPHPLLSWDLGWRLLYRCNSLAGS
jgi:hypothetical protein